MTGKRWILVAAAVVVAGVVAWVWLGRSEAPPAIDLVLQFPSAEKRSSLPLDQAFKVMSVTINGETKPSIYMRPTSRLIYHGVRVPTDAWLSTHVALLPDAWDKEGDGTLFRFGVSDGRSFYDEHLVRLVDPKHKPADRRWIAVTIDLAPYAGRQVDLIFNTNNSLPGHVDDNPQNDEAVWGAPQTRVGR